VPCSSDKIHAIPAVENVKVKSIFKKKEHAKKKTKEN